jgi:alkylation response protein AidB-like acyl-CoA dehydrogenase
MLCCSIMQACCDLAFEYAHTRETFGQKIGTYQVRVILVDVTVVLDKRYAARIQ